MKIPHKICWGCLSVGSMNSGLHNALLTRPWTSHGIYHSLFVYKYSKTCNAQPWYTHNTLGGDVFAQRYIWILENIRICCSQSKSWSLLSVRADISINKFMYTWYMISYFVTTRNKIMYNDNNMVSTIFHLFFMSAVHGVRVESLWRFSTIYTRKPFTKFKKLQV